MKILKCFSTKCETEMDIDEVHSSEKSINQVA